MTSLKKILNFLKQSDGNIMVMVAILMLPVLALSGGGLDVGQAYTLREKLQTTLDSAVLNGVRSLGQNTLATEVQRYMNLSFPPGTGGVTLSPVSITQNLQEKVLTLSVTGTMTTSFLQLVGLNTLTIKATSKAQLMNPLMEIAMVLDNTSSMGQDFTPVGTIRDCSTLSCNKSQSMKHAASLFIDTMSTNQVLHDNVYIGLVPYTTNVNIGPENEEWTTGIAGLNFGNSGWRGCVMQRYQNGLDLTDEPPSTALFEPLRWPSTYGQLFYVNKNPANHPLVSNFRLVVGDNNWKAGNETDTLQGILTNMNNTLGPNAGCGTPITPMTHDYATLKYNITLLNGYNGSGTMTNIGLVWGFNMLSPKWRGLWGGGTPSELPMDYNDPDTQKILILLTDGDNNWSDRSGPNISASSAQSYINEIGQTAWNSIVSYWNNGQTFNGMVRGAPGDPVNSTYPDSDYTSYGRLSEGRLGTTNKANVDGILDSKMTTVCTNMKNQGINIYAITFGTDVSTSAKNLVKSCATSPSQYFHAPSTTNLAGIFSNIGGTIKKIRLLK